MSKLGTEKSISNQIDLPMAEVAGHNGEGIVSRQVRSNKCTEFSFLLFGDSPHYDWNNLDIFPEWRIKNSAQRWR
jgi:hypothetical protein